MTTTTKLQAPYGSWSSKISSESIVQASILLKELIIDTIRNDVYWIEQRPTEGGRYVAVKYDGKTVNDFCPEKANVRSRVHEYGGGAALAYDGTKYLLIC
jgi:hypothetical protein